MENFLSEHGGMLVYGITGMLMLIAVCCFFSGSFRLITPVFYNTENGDNSEFISSNIDNFPVIYADEVICIKSGVDFDYRKYVTAADGSGNDISDKIKAYGTVDLNTPGLYRMKFRVSSSGLNASRCVNILVE